MLVVKMFVSIDQIYNIKKCMKEGWQFNEIFTSQIKISYRNEIMLAFTDGKKNQYIHVTLFNIFQNVFEFEKELFSS